MNINEGVTMERLYSIW